VHDVGDALPALSQLPSFQVPHGQEEFALVVVLGITLESVELLEAADKYPSEISGGMQKRAALARAMVRQAEIVLYDEPTSGLDPVTSAMIHRLIKKFNEERGVTSIVVTHDLAGAMSIADRILLLRNARVAFCGTPREFLKSTDPYAMEYIAATKGITT
jgi:phospholipid/cholesterol/gamma-HCH transport system ATP-binding protein